MVEPCLVSRSVKFEGDVLARVVERAREMLEIDEEEQVREAIVALEVASRWASLIRVLAAAE